jgi:hypothetical protein
MQGGPICIPAVRVGPLLKSGCSNCWDRAAVNHVFRARDGSRARAAKQETR